MATNPMSIPDTNSSEVARIAAAWAIVYHTMTSDSIRETGADKVAAKMTELFNATYNSIAANAQENSPTISSHIG